MSRCSSHQIKSTLKSTLVATISLAAMVSASVALDVPAAHAAGSVLDPTTDVAVTIAAPTSLVRGSQFRAVVSVSNLGSSTARTVTCGIATPRVDAVSAFRLGVSSTRSIDQVDGNESRQIRIAVLAPGQSRTISMSATAVTGTPTPGFTLSAFCTPAHVDAQQQNNAATVKVTLS